MGIMTVILGRRWAGRGYIRVPDMETDRILIVLPRRRRQGEDVAIEAAVALYSEDRWSLVQW